MNYICAVNRWLIVVFLLLGWGCSSSDTELEHVSIDVVDTAVHYIDSVAFNDSIASIDITAIQLDSLPNIDTFSGISVLEQMMIDSGLTRLLDLDSTFVIDLKYSTTDNFLGVDVYGDFNEAYLQPDVAERLVVAQRWLQAHDSTLSLVIFDATRPRSVQYKMWNILDMPAAEKGKFVSNPANGKGSLHNYGAAVDVSIIRSNGEQLDMGTPFDHMGELAYPRLEQALLDSGVITQEVIDNRKLLRRALRKAGMWNIQTEWWHFNACRRDTAIKYYPIIE